MDERVVERWMALEMARMRDAFVTSPRPLGDLLREEAPAVGTRGGLTHVFDKEVLRRFGEALSPLARRQLRLPATFFVDHEAPADAYLPDAAAVELLAALGELPEGRAMREGRLWMGHARAQAIAARYPGAFQFAYQ